MEVRRLLVTADTAFGAGGGRVRRVAACAVLRRPDGDAVLAALGEELGALLAAEALRALDAPALSYGKAAIIGDGGDAEHAAALLHPRMGAPIRAAIGGGKALIPSNAKVAGAGAAIDVPLGHKDDPWAFAFIDTITVHVPDAPRTDEALVVVALADGPRIDARITKAGTPAPIPETSP